MQHHMVTKVALCLMGCLHMANFATLLTQNCHLYGNSGLQPVAAFLQLTAEQVLPPGCSYTQNIWTLFFSHPTLLWLHPALGLSATALLNLICTAGLFISTAAACGVLHPLIFGSLWALFLSVVNIGQAFLPQTGDVALLEMTFACIWLAQCLQQAPPSSPEQQQDQLQGPQLTAANRMQLSAVQPAVLFMRWLLFKLLLLSSSSKATLLCSTVDDLAGCYHAMVAHGQPHVLTWWLQIAPNSVAATVAAASLLQGVAAFAVLCPSALVQQSVAKLLLYLQLVKACVGTLTLADAAAGVLCITLLHDGLLVIGLQRIKKLYTAKLTESAAAKGAVGAAGAELLGYKTGGSHKRSLSADSLASLLSETDLQFPVGLNIRQQQGGLLNSRTSRILLGVVVVCAAVMFGVNNAAQLVLRWAPAQITAVLHILVPCAAALWLVALLNSALGSCRRAVGEAAAMAANAAADASCEPPKALAQLQAGSSAAAVAAAQSNMPHANGLRPSPMAAAMDASDLPAQPHLPAVATTAATEADTGTAKPTRRGRASSAKAADSGSQQGTPRKGSRSKAAAASEDGHDTSEVPAEDSTAAGTPKASRARRAAAPRTKKTAAAPMAEETEAGEDAADTGAFFTPEPAAPAADAAAAASPTTPAVAAAAASVPAAKPAPAAAPSAPPAIKTSAALPITASGLNWANLRWLKPKLHVGSTIWATAVVIAVFVVGLPAVLVPSGYSQTSLKSIPGLLSSYQLARNYGIVSSDSIIQLSLGATAVAALELPGSHLVFELATSADGMEWQPVLFKHGLNEAGPGLGSLRGLYEPRLQDRLVAAGTGNLGDNMWLLSLADKLLEGSADLKAVLAQPVSAHEWVKADLVRYTPSCLSTNGQDGISSSKWVSQTMSAVLPPMARADKDLKDTLAELRWTQPAAGSACSGTLLGIPPVVLVPLLLLAVAARHALADGGILHSLTVQQW